MTIARPATKANRVISELSRHIHDNKELTPFALAGYKRDLMASMSADASEAYAGLGMIAGIEWDIDSVHRNFVNAIRLDNEYTVHANYGVTLTRVGLIKEAAEQYRIAYNLAPTDLKALATAIMGSLVAGELSTALELGVRMTNLASSNKIRELESAVGALEILKSFGCDDSLVQRCNVIAYDILRENRKHSSQMITELDTEDQIIFCSVEVIASPVEVFELDKLLTDRLYDLIADYNPNRYWIGFTPKSAK